MKAHRLTPMPVVLSLLAACAVMSLVFAGGAAAKPAPKCFGKKATIAANGHHHLSGTKGRDVIIGTQGDDKINGKQGDDLICALGGDDVIHGSEGTNELNGGSGDDWLDSRRGDGALVVGGPGKDFIEAQGKLYGGPGNDKIESFGYLKANESPFPDVTDGGEGNDLVTGDNYWFTENSYPLQTLAGGADDDDITGGNDRDRLYGKSGNDKLDGRGGSDICRQGSGSGAVTHCEGNRVSAGARTLAPATSSYSSIAYDRALEADPTIGVGPEPASARRARLRLAGN